MLRDTSPSACAGGSTGPGSSPKSWSRADCDEAARQCEFDITWAHPLRLDPKRIDLALDGAPVWHGKGKERHASVSLGARARPQVLVADAEFPDGTRATYSRTLYAAYPEEAQAALQAVPLLPSPDAGSDESVAAALRSSGWPVRTVEAGEIDVTFVMQPTAFDGVAGFLSNTPDLPGTHQKKIGAITGSDIRVDVIVPNQLLSTYRVAGAELGRRVPVAVPSVSWSRYADAVAAAGYELGSSPRRRAVVLVLNRFDRLNASTFDARQARAYLSEVLVPLVVWRIGPAEVGPEWPEGKVIASLDELRDAFDSLVRDVERQRIAWLEGTRDLRFAGPRVAAAIGLAGRTATDESAVVRGRWRDRRARRGRRARRRRCARARERARGSGRSRRHRMPASSDPPTAPVAGSPPDAASLPGPCEAWPLSEDADVRLRGDRRRTILERRHRHSLARRRGPRSAESSHTCRSRRRPIRARLRRDARRRRPPE